MGTACLAPDLTHYRFRSHTVGGVGEKERRTEMGGVESGREPKKDVRTDRFLPCVPYSKVLPPVDRVDR